MSVGLNLCDGWPGFSQGMRKFFMDRKHLEEVAAFIRDHRSNESNFEALRQKLLEEAKADTKDANYKRALKEINEKQAEEYRTAKEKGSTAWPEFEKFVSEFEKTVTATLKKD